MSKDIQINDKVVIPADEIVFSASRSRGPGGQYVNTTSSRVTLQWNAMETNALDEKERSLVLNRLSSRISEKGMLTIHSDSERSQHRNRKIAIERFVEMLRNALIIQKKRIATKKSRSAERQRLSDKKRRSEIKRTRKNHEEC